MLGLSSSEIRIYFRSTSPTQPDREQKKIMQQVDRSSNIVDRFMLMTIEKHSYIHITDVMLYTVQRSPTWRHFQQEF